ncbi:MAG: hypothetical protein CW716_10525 [Candidatus Bathyarchaeum sp.]|nr:MAG: hypothetical protein CW716_10525 [Candidatus Bathyarchaeum sp.]
MNKTDFRKSGLISAMIVALACAVFVPAVSADQHFSVSDSYFGEGVGAGVMATYSNGSYSDCFWHVGRWLGACDGYFTDLYYTFYEDGTPTYGSTSNPYADQNKTGPFSSLGASGASAFFEIYYGVIYWSSGLAWLPQ